MRFPLLEQRTAFSLKTNAQTHIANNFLKSNSVSHVAMILMVNYHLIVFFYILTFLSINIDSDHGEENGYAGIDRKNKKKKSKKRTASDLDSRGEMHVDAGKQDVLCNILISNFSTTLVFKSFLIFSSYQFRTFEFLM